MGIDKRTITAWETGNATPRATNLKKIAAAWGLSYQDFLAGPKDHATKPVQVIEEKFDRNVSMGIMSRIFLLSDIHHSLDHSDILGITSVLSLRDRPDKWIVVVIDKDKQPLPRSQKVAINLLEEPRPGDLVLVWAQKSGAHFVEWDERSRHDQYDTVYGPVIRRQKSNVS